MAVKKAGSSTSNTRDSRSKRLGLKVYPGASVTPGNIIMRQRGAKFRAGSGCEMGRDFTIFAVQAGLVRAYRHSKKVFFYIENNQ